MTNVSLSFWEEFKRSTILQAVLTIMIWAALIAMWFLKLPVPFELSAAATMTLGFYFGSKVGQAQRAGG